MIEDIDQILYICCVHSPRTHEISKETISTWHAYVRAELQVGQVQTWVHARDYCSDSYVLPRQSPLS